MEFDSMRPLQIQSTSQNSP